jgi:membrane protease YdiL (CAAX protease family)
MLDVTRSDSTCTHRLLSSALQASWWNAHMATAAAPRPDAWRVVAWVAFIGAISVLNYAYRFEGETTPSDVAYRYSTSVALVVQYAAFLGVVLLIALHLPKREVFALRRPVTWGRGLSSIGMGLGAIWVMAFVYTLALSLVTDLTPTDEQGLVPTEWDSKRAGAFVLFFLGVTVVGPLVEELMFRGLGISLFLARGRWPAILITGVFFGLYHGLLLALPVLVAFGIVLGWVRVRTDSIYPGIVLHATFNGVALIVAVAG